MKRRGLCTGLAALTVAASCWRGAAAQPALRRVGMLGMARPDPDSAVWREFVAELARRGHTVGHNLVFEHRFCDWNQPELIDQLASELVSLRVDVIVSTGGPRSAQAAKNATTTIPIIFFASGDPVREGLVASLARPGGNLTGNSVRLHDLGPKALQYFADALGKPTRIAYLHPQGTKSEAWFADFSASMAQAAQALGARLEFVEVASVEELKSLVPRLVRERFDAAIVWSWPMFRSQLSSIAALFAEHRLPAYGSAHDGFLLHYGEPALRMARTAAAYVDRILKGARPADLPVEQVTFVELVVNLKTAKALGLKLPPALLQRADEVIE